MTDDLKCPHCFKEDAILCHTEIRHNHPGNIYKCKICELVFLYPRLSEQDQKLYYAKAYRNEYQDNPVEERFYADHHEALVRLSRVEEHAAARDSLLEIGSGSGAFLSLAQEKWERVVGIEPDLRTQKFLKAHNINVRSELNELKGSKFSIIVMFHVLEHILDPVNFLKTLHSYLEADGCIVIEVPNIDDVLISIYDIPEFKNFYFCSAHVSYFSPKTLNACFFEAGFTGDIFPVQRYNLNNHLHWLKHKTPQDKKENIFNFLSNETIETYKKDLCEQGLNDTLFSIIKKIT